MNRLEVRLVKGMVSLAALAAFGGLAGPAVASATSDIPDTSRTNSAVAHSYDGNLSVRSVDDHAPPPPPRPARPPHRPGLIHPWAPFAVNPNNHK